MKDTEVIPFPQIKVIKIETNIAEESNKSIWNEVSKLERIKEKINFSEFESYFYQKENIIIKNEENEFKGSLNEKIIFELLNQLEESEIIFCIEQLPNYIFEIESEVLILKYIKEVIFIS
jgi:hypothetical protein